MPIELNPQMIEAAKKRISDSFGEIVIKSGCFPDFELSYRSLNSANIVLPKRGNIFDKIETYLGETPIFDFLFDDIWRHFYDFHKHDEKAAPFKITDIEKFRDPDEYIGNILKKITTLPWRYSLSVEIPDAMLRNTILASGGMEFGNKSHIKHSDLLTEEIFPLSNTPEHLRSRAKSGAQLYTGKPGWDAGKPHYRTFAEGFVRSYRSCVTLDAVERELESILGMGLAMHMLSFKSPAGQKINKVDWIVHREEKDGSWEFDSRFPIDDELCETISNLVSFEFPETIQENVKDAWIKNVSSKIGKVLNLSNTDIIMLSSKWYFDSYKKSDKTLSYIRMMTSLEILLGDRSGAEKMSLGEIIGNRLAYLIGKSVKDRNDILSKFKEVYNLRSRILHQGKHKLSSSDSHLMSILKNYCERAISAEVEMLIVK
jgi:hypothetical protein